VAGVGSRDPFALTHGEHRQARASTPGLRMCRWYTRRAQRTCPLPRPSRHRGERRF
jgi:hypothetical protein